MLRLRLAQRATTKTDNTKHSTFTKSIQTNAALACRKFLDDATITHLHLNSGLMKVKLVSKNGKLKRNRYATRPKLYRSIATFLAVAFLSLLFVMWSQDHESLHLSLQSETQTSYCTSRFTVAGLDHPRLGARDEFGNLGCVVNLAHLQIKMEEAKKRYDNAQTSCQSDQAVAIEGEGGNKVLQKVRKGLDQSVQNNAELASNPRILCMVYTVHVETNPHESLAAIAQTWATKCDGFFAASNLTDPFVGAIDLPHFGGESYNNMWQKVRTMWSYAHDHYRDEYDYFYICGDDVYVVVDNLRSFLNSPRIQELENGYLDSIASNERFKDRVYPSSILRPRPLVWGDPVIHKRFPVAAGGGGYVMNRASLTLWGAKGTDTYFPTSIDSREDIMMFSFLSDNHVFISDTIDSNGAHRFTESAEFVYNFNGKNGPTSPLMLKRFLDIPMNTKMEYASETLIAFHLKLDKKRLQKQNRSIADLMLRYHAVLYRTCKLDS